MSSLSLSDTSRVYNETVRPLLPRADVVLDLDETIPNPPKTSTTDAHLPIDDCRGLLEPSFSQSTGSKSPVMEKPRSKSSGGVDTSDEIEFRVGKDRQLMIGSKMKLAAISPVFRSMFSESQTKKETMVDIPNFHNQSFGVILRAASRDNDPPLTEDTVWHVLHAAHQFQVLPVVSRCFRFLLHKHPRRRRSHHLCKVLEKAHQLSYSEHQASCLRMVKRHAGKVFSSEAALSELCHQCMLQLVQAEDLPVPETLVHDAVVTWARAACKGGDDGGAGDASEPSWEELRAVAGQLVFQVRYLAMPRHVLLGLPAGQPGCLLRDKEKTCLLEGFLSSFPPHVATPRKGQGLTLWSGFRGAVCVRDKDSARMPLCLLVSSVITLLLVAAFLVVFYLCLSSEASVASASSTASPESSDSQVYVLMAQEERQ